MAKESLSQRNRRLRADEGRLRPMTPAQRKAEYARLRISGGYSAEDLDDLKARLRVKPVPALPSGTANSCDAPTEPAVPAAPASKQSPEELDPEVQAQRFLGWRVKPVGGPEYTVTDVLGAGGEGAVLRLERAGEKGGKKWAAVLACKTALEPNLDAQERIQAEAEILRPIRHPGVVPFKSVGKMHDPAGQESGRCYLMEIAPGAESLERWMNRQRKLMPPLKFAAHILRFLSGVIPILEYLLNEHSLVHGDLSRNNFLVCGDRVWLIDFGMARKVRRWKQGFAEAPHFGGSPGYAAPEQRGGGRIHRNSNSYALGALAAGGLAGWNGSDLDARLFEPANGPDAFPDRFKNLSPEHITTEITGHILAHGLRQRLLQDRAAGLLSLIRGTLVASPDQRLELGPLRESFEALARTLELHIWPPHLAALPEIPADRRLFGRKGLLELIQRHFRAAQSGPVIVLLHALGGMGKTATCEKLIHLAFPTADEDLRAEAASLPGAYPDQPHYDAILWSTAPDLPTFEAGIRSYCKALKLANDETDLAELKRRFRAHLEAHPALWIINNLHDESIQHRDPDGHPQTGWLSGWLPTNGAAHVVITSRLTQSEIPGLADRTDVIAIHLDSLPEADALDFLCQRGERAMPAGRELDFARKIVGRDGLAGLPLALELAAMYLWLFAPARSATPVSFEEYWRLLEADARVIDRAFSDAEKRSGRVNKERLRSVGMAWKSLFEFIQREHPAAAALLKLSSVLPADDIPAELVSPAIAWPDPALGELLAEPASAERERALEIQLGHLAGVSLVERKPLQNTWSVHRLVQKAMQREMGEETVQRWRAAAARAVVMAFAGLDFSPDSRVWGQGRRWFPSYLATCSEWKTSAYLGEEELYFAWRTLSVFAFLKGDTSLAVASARNAIDGVSRLVEVLPAEADWQVCLGGSYALLGDILMFQGNWREASQIFSKALDIVNRVDESNLTGASKPFLWSLVSAKLGEVALCEGNLPDADQFFDHAFSILQRLADSGFDNVGRWAYWTLSGALLKVGLDRGFLAEEQGNLFEAQRRFGIVLRLAQGLAASDPANFRWQSFVLESFLALGNVEMELAEEVISIDDGDCVVELAEGNLPEAQRLFGEALRLAQLLAESNPDEVEWRERAAQSHLRIGIIQRRLGELSAAKESVARCRDLIQRLTDSDPANFRWQTLAFESFRASGNVEMELAQVIYADDGDGLELAEGNLPEAQRFFGEALRIANRLAEFDAAAVEWEAFVAEIHFNIGMIQRRLGELSAAKESVARCRDLMQRLTDSDPANAEWHGHLYRSYWWLGDLCELNSQSAEARAWWREAHDTLAGMQQRGIMQPIDEHHLETLRAKVGGH